MLKKNTIPTIIGIITLIVGTFVGVFLLNNTQIFRTSASADSAPKDIRVGNISDNSVTLSWTTDKSSADFVSWGSSQGSVSTVVAEATSGETFFNHSVTISGLSPSTNYFYKINSDGSDFDNNGIPWQFTTGPTLGVSKNSILVSGNVINAGGVPEKKALVYANINNYLLSTLTSDSGNFVFQLGSTRTPDLSSFAQIDANSTLIQISVAAAPDGVASAQIFSQSANPLPAIVIGQVYDFRNNPPNSLGENPNANISLPQVATESSKFNISTPSGTPKPSSVILESLTEGETINTTKPQFFGKGPGGQTLTITVHSQNPVTQTVQIPKSGESWSYTVPSDLAPGNHTITISWVDPTGITRMLQRDFTVKAGEVPAFTASQSGTLFSPTPTPFGSPQPTAQAASASATAIPVPVTGDLTPTLILSIMGMLVIIFGVSVWKLAEV